MEAQSGSDVSIKDDTSKVKVRLQAGEQIPLRC